jgi:hypothetical protein
MAIRPNGDGEERRPLDYEEPAPRELEPPKHRVSKDIFDSADLVGQNMLENSDRRNPLSVMGAYERAFPVTVPLSRRAKTGVASCY